MVGTPNRLEYDQGFFVKNGDGAADVKPIAHLYKSRCTRWRAHGAAAEVCAAEPTTDTYSLPQGRTSSISRFRYRDMDLALWALNHDVPAAALAAALGISEQQAQWVYDDIATKRRSTRYLHLPPQLIESVDEVKF